MSVQSCLVHKQHSKMGTSVRNTVPHKLRRAAVVNLQNSSPLCKACSCPVVVSTALTKVIKALSGGFL